MKFNKNLSKARTADSTVVSTDAGSMCDKTAFIGKTVVETRCVKRSELLMYSLDPWSCIQREMTAFREGGLFPKSTLFYEGSQSRIREII